jgi:hypothetical protein
MRAQGWISRERARRATRLATAEMALRSLEDTPKAPDRADRAPAEGRAAKGARVTGNAVLPSRLAALPPVAAAGHVVLADLASRREVGEHAHGEQVGEAVGDRLGGGRFADVDVVDRAGDVAGGLFGVVDQSGRLGVG